MPDAPKKIPPFSDINGDHMNCDDVKYWFKETGKCTNNCECNSNRKCVGTEGKCVDRVDANKSSIRVN